MRGSGQGRHDAVPRMGAPLIRSHARDAWCGRAAGGTEAMVRSSSRVCHYPKAGPISHGAGKQRADGLQMGPERLALGCP